MSQSPLSNSNYKTLKDRVTKWWTDKQHDVREQPNNKTMAQRMMTRWFDKDTFHNQQNKAKQRIANILTHLNPTNTIKQARQDTKKWVENQQDKARQHTNDLLTRLNPIHRIRQGMSNLDPTAKLRAIRRTSLVFVAVACFAYGFGANLPKAVADYAKYTMTPKSNER